MAKEREEMDEGVEDPAEAGVADEAELTAKVPDHREEGVLGEDEQPHTTDPDKDHANEPQAIPELQAASDRGMEAPALSEGDSFPAIDEASGAPDPLHEENKPVLEKDADLSDAPLTDIEPGPADDRRSEPSEAPAAGNEPEGDESFAKEEPMTDIASEDTIPSIDLRNYGKTFSDGETVSTETDRGEEMNADLPDAPPINIGSDAEIKESEPREAQLGNEPELSEASVKEELTAPVVQEDMVQDIDVPSVADTTNSSEGLPAETLLEAKRDVENADQPLIDVQPGSAESQSVPPSETQIGNDLESDDLLVREEETTAIGQDDSMPDDEEFPGKPTLEGEPHPGGNQEGIEPDVELPNAPPSSIGSINERGPVPFEAQDGNNRELVEASLEEEPLLGVAHEDLGPDNVATSPDSRGIDRGFDEKSAAEVYVMDSVTGHEQPENIEAATGEGPFDIDPEGAPKTPVKTDEGPAAVQSESSEDLTKTQPEALPETDVIGDVDSLDMEMGAAPVDVQAERDLEPAAVEMDEGARLASIEPEAAPDTEAAVETEDGFPGTQSGMYQETDQMQSGLDAGETEPGKNVHSPMETGVESEPERSTDISLDTHTGAAPKPEEVEGEENGDSGNEVSIEPSDLGPSKDNMDEAGSFGEAGANSQDTTHQESELVDGFKPVNEAQSDMGPEADTQVSEPGVEVPSATKFEENDDSGNEVSIEPSYAGPSKDNNDETGNFGEAGVNSQDMTRQESELVVGFKPFNEALSDTGPEADTQVSEPGVEVPSATNLEENGDSGNEVSIEPSYAGPSKDNTDEAGNFGEAGVNSQDMTRQESELVVGFKPFNEALSGMGPEADTQVPEPGVQAPLDTKFEENFDLGNEVSIEPSDVGPLENNMDEAGSFGEAGVNPQDMIRQESELGDGFKPVNEAQSDMGPEADTQVPEPGVEVPLDTKFEDNSDSGNEVSIEPSGVGPSKDNMDEAGSFGEAGVNSRDMTRQESELVDGFKPVNEALSDMGPEADTQVSEPGVDVLLDTKFEEKGDSGNELSIEPSDLGTSKDIMDEAGSFGEAGVKSEDMARQESELVDGSEPLNEAVSHMGPEAETQVPEPGVEVPLDTKFDQAGSYETESGQQDGIAAEQSRQVDYAGDEQKEIDFIMAEQGQQDDNMEAEQKRDSIVEPPEVPIVEPEAEVEATELEPKAEDLSKLKLDEESPSEFERDQQEVLTVEQDQLKQEQDKQELRYEAKPSGESEMSEEAIIPSLPIKSESSVDEYEPTNRSVLEPSGGSDSPSGDGERDIGEEEAALSTAAEAGSAITDFDENPSYQQLSSEFAGSEQDAGVSESRESGEAFVSENNGSDDSSPPIVPDYIGTGPTEHVESERSDGGQKHKKEDSLKEEVEWKAAQDLEPAVALKEDTPGMPEVETTSTNGPESLTLPADVRVSEESNKPEEATTKEAGDGDKPSHGTVPLALGDLPKDNLDTVEPNISISKENPSTRVPVNPLPSNASDRGPPQVTSGQDMNDTEGFSQQKTRDASLPMEVPVQDVKQRALDQENLRGPERPNREGTVQRRSNLLGCCGMFDLLTGKN